MTLISDIITDGYRENNITGINATPTVTETAEGLKLLNRFILSLVGYEAGESLISFSLGNNNEFTNQNLYTFYSLPDNFIPAQARLILNLTESQTINLSPNPLDGSRFAILDASNNLATYPLTINGNGRNIEGLATQVYNTNGLIREWMYRADLGSWQPIAFLTTTDQSPFPLEFDELLVTGLAMRLNPRHGKATSQETMAVYNRSNAKFKTKYRQTIQVPTELALLRTNGNKYWNNYFDYLSDNENFNRGYGYGY